MEVEGNLARITCGQLDRKLYAEVNDALAALGGKWNRAKKGHLFEVDPRSAIEQVAVDGEFSNEARDFEFFATPYAVTERLLALVDLKPGDKVLEPSCGEGSLIGAVLQRYPGVEIHAFDVRESAVAKVRAKYPAVRVTQVDFLSMKPGVRYRAVVMNPPFSRQQDIDHVLHAHRFLAKGGKLVSVMGAGVSFRTNRKAVEFREFVEGHGGSIEELPAGSFKTSGTNVNTCVVEIPE